MGRITSAVRRVNELRKRGGRDVPCGYYTVVADEDRSDLPLHTI